MYCGRMKIELSNNSITIEATKEEFDISSDDQSEKLIHFIQKLRLIELEIKREELRMVTAMSDTEKQAS